MIVGEKKNKKKDVINQNQENIVNVEQYVS